MGLSSSQVINTEQFINYKIDDIYFTNFEFLDYENDFIGIQNIIFKINGIKYYAYINNTECIKNNNQKISILGLKGIHLNEFNLKYRPMFRCLKKYFKIPYYEIIDKAENVYKVNIISIFEFNRFIDKTQ